MTTAEVAQELVDLCKQGKNMEAVEKFYADDIVTTEAGEMPGMPARQQGIDAVKAKHEWWFNAFEIHGTTAEGPYVNGDRFLVRFTADTTMKETGQRHEGVEMGLYTVKDGKIVEEFFFSNPADYC